MQETFPETGVFTVHFLLNIFVDTLLLLLFRRCRRAQHPRFAVPFRSMTRQVSLHIDQMSPLFVVSMNLDAEFF